ncbi:MAG: NifB/NifX family molybdenum-iron cluster-binding protein [Candidatus Zhuqueibacterota bacterium]
MKLAIGTDDGMTIRQGHFGESKYYSICEILNGIFFTQELRQNPFRDEKHAVHGQTENIMDLLNDCQIFIAKSYGMKSLKKIVQNKIDAIITDLDDIERTVQFYLHSEDIHFKYYDDENGQFNACSDRN